MPTLRANLIIHEKYNYELEIIDDHRRYGHVVISHRYHYLIIHPKYHLEMNSLGHSNQLDYKHFRLNLAIIKLIDLIRINVPSYFSCYRVRDQYYDINLIIDYEHKQRVVDLVQRFECKFLEEQHSRLVYWMRRYLEDDSEDGQYITKPLYKPMDRLLITPFTNAFYETNGKITMQTDFVTITIEDGFTSNGEYSIIFKMSSYGDYYSYYDSLERFVRNMLDERFQEELFLKQINLYNKTQCICINTHKPEMDLNIVNKVRHFVLNNNIVINKVTKEKIEE